MNEFEQPLLVPDAEQSPQPSAAVASMIERIESGIAQSQAGGFHNIKVEGKSLPEFLATDLFKAGLEPDEVRLVLDKYLPPVNTPAPKPYHGYDHAQRASGEYLDRDD